MARARASADSSLMDAKAARSEAWAALAYKALPLDTLVTLLRAFGEPSAILDASRSDLAAVVPAAAVSRLMEPLPEASMAAIRAWLTEPGNDLVAWDDPDYPRALLELGHAPPVLYFVGRRELLNRPALAIVGSRNATPQGLDNARAFARALADAGLTIISGLALGIDAAAHEGALDGHGSTLAVVGTGLDRVYPARHRELAHKLAVHGGLLSEFSPGTPARASHFPRRNRLISGLARGVLVVEAALSSGSLITARYAGEQGREVFAIPGSVHSPLARGCHKLIREGAKLVETAQDVLAELGLANRTAAVVHATAIDADGPHAALLGALAADSADLDQLVARTGLSTQALCANLMALELDGKVAALPGGRWQRRP